MNAEEPSPRAPQDETATLIMVLGFCSLALPLLGPVAWYLGHDHRKRCAREGRQPHENALMGY